MVKFKSQFWWITVLLEAIIFAFAIASLVTDIWWTLWCWVILGALYLATTFVVSWDGEPEPIIPVSERSLASLWSWIFTLVTSLVGANSAVEALISKGDKTPEGILATMIACLGVIISWALLHLMFAQIYEISDAKSGWQNFEFLDAKSHKAKPTAPNTTVYLNYLYFAFCIGSTFATSDTSVCTVQGRRLVLVHSVISFFYNAAVVAISFQVLQVLAYG